MPIEEATSQPLGRLAQGVPRVRITKITSTWVASDSMNPPVWNSASLARNHHSSRPKVRKSNSDDTGPTTSRPSRSTRARGATCAGRYSGETAAEPPSRPHNGRRKAAAAGRR